jgi:hypothetical protein
MLATITIYTFYSAGYIAAYSVLASGDVDLCLVPEVEVKLHGPTVSRCTCLDVQDTFRSLKYCDNMVLHCVGHVPAVDCTGVTFLLR